MHAVLAKWGLPSDQAELHQIAPRVWRVEAGSKVYLLKHRSDHSSVWAEFKLLNYLSEQGLPVFPPLLSDEEAPWARWEGRIYVLYPYIAGVSGEGVCPTDLARARSLGRFLARLHSALAQYPYAEEFPDKNVFQEVATWAWPTVRRGFRNELAGRLEDIAKKLSQFATLYESLPRQLIHRDAHPANVVFEGDEVVGMVDFDMVHTGVRIFDVCYCATAVLSGSFTQGPAREHWDLFVQELLRGYVEVQPLTRSEGYAFMYVTFLIQALFAAYFLDMGQDALAEQNVAMLKWLCDRQTVMEPLIDRVIKSKEDVQ